MAISKNVLRGSISVFCDYFYIYLNELSIMYVVETQFGIFMFRISIMNLLFNHDSVSDVT